MSGSLEISGGGFSFPCDWLGWAGLQASHRSLLHCSVRCPFPKPGFQLAERRLLVRVHNQKQFDGSRLRAQAEAAGVSVGQAYSEWGALELAFCNVSADLQLMNFGPPGAQWELNLCDWCCLW